MLKCFLPGSVEGHVSFDLAILLFAFRDCKGLDLMNQVAVSLFLVIK